MGVGFCGGVEAEGDGHDFGFAEEESEMDDLSIYTIIYLGFSRRKMRERERERERELEAYLLSDSCVRTSLR